MVPPLPLAVSDGVVVFPAVEADQAALAATRAARTANDAQELDRPFAIAPRLRPSRRHRNGTSSRPRACSVLTALTPDCGTAFTLLAVDVLTIGQLAQAAGVNVETVRYYERRRLLREPPRTISGYRQYSSADLWRLQFIARAKQLGFTLSEIADLMEAHDGSDGIGPVESVLRMARSKIDALDARQKQLADTRARLERLVDICADPDSDDCIALRVSSTAAADV